MVILPPKSVHFVSCITCATYVHKYTGNWWAVSESSNMVKAERRQNPNMQKILKYGEDLTNLAQEDKLDPVIGREDVIQTVIQILCKRTKNNPCLVGEPGVGKTVIAEALAQLIVSANAPSSLKGKKIISLNTARLLGGAENRGELEQRITSVVDEVRKGDGNIILFIDEIHIVIGLGAGGGSALDAGNILKPALARGECKCIGATTLYEYRKHIEKDPTLARRFQLVQIPEPSVNEAIDMLRVLCKVYEKHHNVQYEDEALVAAVQLSNYHISDGFLPDKSLDIIDEAGSRANLLQSQDQSRVSTLFPLKKVTKGDIEHIVSARTGIPLEKLSTEESKRLLKMEETLHQHIIGQDKAIKAICSAIQRARLGIRDPGRPICSFLSLAQQE